MAIDYLVEERSDSRLIRRETPVAAHQCWACGRTATWEEIRLEQLVEGSTSLASIVVLCDACQEWKPPLTDLTQAQLWRDVLRRVGRQAVATDG